MAWLKIETHTPDKPEVFDISDQLGISSDDAFGKCFRVWCWFDAHTTNGKTNGIGVSDSLIDRVAGVSGFAKAMHSAGWLDWDGECYAMPNFDSHNGESAKQRALTAKRVAKHTEKTNAKTNAPSVTAPLAREEKRREEVNQSQQLTPSAASPSEATPQEFIFTLGKKLLGDKAGSLIGKARKVWGDEKVTEVLAYMSAMSPPVSDPIPYFIKATTPKPRRVAA